MFEPTKNGHGETGKACRFDGKGLAHVAAVVNITALTRTS